MKSQKSVEIAVRRFSSFVCNLIQGTACISVGAIYINECPASPDLPYYTIVLGVLCLCCSISDAFAGARNIDEDDVPGRVVCGVCVIVLGICVFYVSYVVMVFSLWEPNYEPGSYDYCNKTLYLFSFVYICIDLAPAAIPLILLALILSGLVLAFSLACCIIVLCSPVIILAMICGDVKIDKNFKFMHISFSKKSKSRKKKKSSSKTSVSSTSSVSSSASVLVASPSSNINSSEMSLGPVLVASPNTDTSDISVSETSSGHILVSSPDAKIVMSTPKSSSGEQVLISSPGAKMAVSSGSFKTSSGNNVFTK